MIGELPPLLMLSTFGRRLLISRTETVVFEGRILDCGKKQAENITVLQNMFRGENRSLRLKISDGDVGRQ